MVMMEDLTRVITVGFSAGFVSGFAMFLTNWVAAVALKIIERA
jgi:hypothetical protein